jgi:hypothetical protein
MSAPARLVVGPFSFRIDKAATRVTKSWSIFNGDEEVG